MRRSSCHHPNAVLHTSSFHRRPYPAPARTTVFLVQDKLVWIDCEMTGLRLESDKLIEIAALVTDSDLNILGEGVDIVIHADDDALAAMPDVVKSYRFQRISSDRTTAVTPPPGDLLPNRRFG